MTVNATTRKAGPFTGDGVIVNLPFTFAVLDAATVAVTKNLTSSGADTVLTYGVDFTVTLNGDQTANPGGTAVLTSPLPSGYTAAVTSNIPASQALHIPNGSAFYPAALESAFDKLTMLVQQNDEQLSRALLGSPTGGGVDVSALIATAQASATSAGASATAAASSASAASASQTASSTNAANASVFATNASDSADAAAASAALAASYVGAAFAGVNATYNGSSSNPNVSAGANNYLYLVAATTYSRSITLPNSPADGFTVTITHTANAGATFGYDVLLTGGGRVNSIVASYCTLAPGMTIRCTWSAVASEWVVETWGGLNSNLGTNGPDMVADINGLTVSTTSQVRARDKYGRTRIINTGTLTANMSAIDTGTRSANTWYFVYAVYTPSASTQLYLRYSLFAAAPSIADYTNGSAFIARLGAVRTDSTNTGFLSTRTSGRRSEYRVTGATGGTALPVLFTGAFGNPVTPTWFAINVSNLVPATATSIQGFVMPTSSTNGVAAIGPDNQYAAYNDVTNPPPYTTVGSWSTQSTRANFDIALRASFQSVYVGSQTSTKGFVTGWEESAP